MISSVKAYKASDGSLHGSPEEAQRAELAHLLQGDVNALAADIIDNRITDAPACAIYLMDTIHRHREKLIDILTTGPRSRPARRSINGGTTKRAKRPKQSAPASPEVSTAGFQAMREAAGVEVEA